MSLSVRLSIIITNIVLRIIIIIVANIIAIDFFLEKVLNYGWVGVKSPKLVKM